MTANEFRQTHGNPATWTTAGIESFEVLRLNDDHLSQPQHCIAGGITRSGKGHTTQPLTLTPTA